MHFAFLFFRFGYHVIYVIVLCVCNVYVFVYCERNSLKKQRQRVESIGINFSVVHTNSIGIYGFEYPCACALAFWNINYSTTTRKKKKKLKSSEYTFQFGFWSSIYHHLLNFSCFFYFSSVFQFEIFICQTSPDTESLIIILLVESVYVGCGNWKKKHENTKVLFCVLKFICIPVEIEIQYSLLLWKQFYLGFGLCVCVRQCVPLWFFFRSNRKPTSKPKPKKKEEKNWKVFVLYIPISESKRKKKLKNICWKVKRAPTENKNQNSNKYIRKKRR